MKNTHIPIDIHYFDAKGKLIQSHQMRVEKDPANPKQAYDSVKPAVTALEVAPGSLKDAKPLQAILCVDTLPTQ